MKIEAVHEPIEVITYFDRNEIRPLRFRWRQRAYHVSSVNGVWRDVKGQTRLYHFHVATKESGSFELIYNAADLSWMLGRVLLEE
ncbi:MAG: hypothetical protein ONB24_01600 [candidate division KSB1 bacterium]|nr:hypothetical protein [candidate division KSB1 bacterium]MDZ7370183.1 hypothetical protein [candidate division KSB1 bacterium]